MSYGEPATPLTVSHPALPQAVGVLQAARQTATKAASQAGLASHQLGFAMAMAYQSCGLRAQTVCAFYIWRVRASGSGAWVSPTP
jgi:hypothetical protein